MSLYILVDGSNIPQYKFKEGRKFAEAKYLKILLKYCEQLKMTFPNVIPIVFVDANLRYVIDDQEWLKEQIHTGQIFECPSGEPADNILISLLKAMPDRVLIISDDQFREYEIPGICHYVRWRFGVIRIGNRIIIPHIEELLKGLFGINGILARTPPVCEIKVERPEVKV